MYPDARQSWMSLVIDEATVPVTAKADRLPVPLAIGIMVGASAGLWLGIIKIVSMIG
jgi:hypothetical protein